MATKMTAQERKWAIERDARALTEAEEIKADPKRLAPAKKEAVKQALYSKRAAEAATRAAATPAKGAKAPAKKATKRASRKR